MNLLRFSSRESGERIELRPTTLMSGGALGSTPSFIPKAYRGHGKESNALTAEGMIADKENGRGGEIRTHDLLYPKQAR